MNIQKKVTTAVATTALFLNFLTPVAAQTISGNNSGSSNYINTDYDYDFDLDQNNDATVNNSVNISLDSGGNSVKDVVGGEIDLETGDIEAGVQIMNQLNMNVASFDTCGSCGLSGDFKIADNNVGDNKDKDGDNDIKYEYDSNVDLDQDNDADVENDVDVTGKSGDNEVDDTMNGNVSIDTGSVTVNPIIIKNALNANWAVVASSDEEDGGVSAWILGNNSDSDNFIDLDVENDLELDQDNDADVESDVAVKVESGENDVDDVAGAAVSIDTGDVEVGVMIDTMANFNMAAVEDCCFLGDQVTKIADNNVDTDNDIEVDLDLDVELDQDNDFDCGGSRNVFDKLFGGYDGGKDCNDVDVTGGTGDNEVEDASAGGHDPEITTGDAAAAIQLSTSANVNVEGGTDVDFDVDFGEVSDLLGDLFDLLD